MPDATHHQRLDRFNRLFELIRQRDMALSIEHRRRTVNAERPNPIDAQQSFVTHAVKSLNRTQNRIVVF